MAFINGIGLISPQKTADPKEFPAEIMEYTADYLKCIEPAYRSYIDPLQSRRMSRLIKMGITAAKIAINDAGCRMPGAIITGTGLGNVRDTEKILGEITHEERFMNPTPFIQSTYNTISSQIAIQLQCHNYNSTYVHRTFSFESALIDGLMQIEEHTASEVLAGAIDEMTLNHLQITRRIGQWKMSPSNNLKILEYNTPGALAGEGAAFFVLGAEKSASTYAVLQDVKTCINIGGSFQPDREINDFLEKNDLSAGDIDLLMLGLNGDCMHDPVYKKFAGELFPGRAQAWFKHLCGEYHTATGFGLWAAACILKNQVYPGILRFNQVVPPGLKNILIYNQLNNTNHSFMLISRQ
ncbi:MAG: beta-ketoacyl synthase N-terminal-like domain-containing protein [Bacteroidota bacterium]